MKEASSGQSPKYSRPIFSFSLKVFFLGLVSLLTDVSSEMIFTILPLFLSNVLMARTVIIGLIGGVADGADAILRVFSGWVSDKIGQRKLFAVLGYGISTIAKPFMYFATAWAPVLAIRLGDRVGKGIRTSPRDALIADSTSPDEMGKSFGFHRAMDTSGAIIGLSIAAAIVYFLQRGTLQLARDTYQWLVLVGVVPAVIAVLVLLFFVREGKRGGFSNSRLEDTNFPGNEELQAKITSVLPSRGFDIQFKIFLAIMVLFTLGNSSDFFLILRAQNLEFSTFHIFLALILFNVIYALVASPAGMLSDKLGRKRLIVSGWLIYSLAYLGFALASARWQVWSLFAVYGLYHGITDGVARAFVADMVPEERRGTAYGLYHGAVGITLVLASLIAGWLWVLNPVNPTAPFFFGARMAGIATVAFIAFIRE